MAGFAAGGFAAGAGRSAVRGVAGVDGGGCAGRWFSRGVAAGVDGGGSYWTLDLARGRRRGQWRRRCWSLHRRRWNRRRRRSPLWRSYASRPIRLRRRRRRDRGRSSSLHLPHLWPRRRRLALTDLLYLIGIQRPAGVRRQGLLFLCERHGRRRRRPLRNHRARLQSSGRLHNLAPREERF